MFKSLKLAIGPRVRKSPYYESPEEQLEATLVDCLGLKKELNVIL
jgi:hypothetical protein|tara:strand:+ start:688 stop:822 length:135 start_codon:yes stop_codon:yes gene_type:complete